MDKGEVPSVVYIVAVGFSMRTVVAGKGTGRPMSVVWPLTVNLYIVRLCPRARLGIVRARLRRVVVNIVK